MISHRPLRPRGSYTTRPRGSTPQPRQRIPCITVNDDHIVKAEDVDDATEMVRLQYFAEEAAPQRERMSTSKRQRREQ
eukprot:6463836-Amphidinium_carterae.4